MACTMILFMARSAGYKWKYLLFPEAVTSILSVLFIASAGYIINDYFDRDADKINKPNKSYIGNSISVKNAWIYYSVMVILGLLFSFITSVKLGYLSMAVSLALFFYSYELKGQYLNGNLLIAFLSGLVIFISTYGVHTLAYKSGGFFLEFAILAFLISLAREVVKTAEDIDGDKVAGRKTVAVIWGVRTVKWIAFLCIFLTAIISMWLQSEFGITGALYYVVFAILLPLAVSLAILYIAKRKSQFSLVSAIYKAVMISGLLLVFWLRNP